MSLRTALPATGLALLLAACSSIQPDPGAPGRAGAAAGACHRESSSLFQYRTTTRSRAANPSFVQNWPVRLRRFWNWEQRDSIEPLPMGTPSLALAA